MNKAKALYIHIPFCEKICDYCDFTKLQYFRHFAVNYLEALQKEIENYHIGQLETIYVGGGTPTALEDDLFETLLEIIKPYAEGVKEYTFEANPESLSEKKIVLLSQYGVNRVSIGVQSTNDEILKYINRNHTFKEVVDAVNNLKKHGINSINVDLILGLPHTNKKYLLEDLMNIDSLNVSHLSCYALTIHPHTVLFNKGFNEESDDKMREYYDIVQNYLFNTDFIHYEVSNWAKPGKESLHNLTYWRNEPYYGVGLGASGYLDNVRYKNTINLTKYLKGEYIEETEIVTQNDKFTYQIMLNMRTLEGLNYKKLKEEFDYDILKEKGEEIKALVNNGYLYFKDDALHPTYEGMMTLDQIILKLI